MDDVENQGVLPEETQAQTEIAAPETESAQDQSYQAEAQAKQNHAWAAMRKRNEELERRVAVQEEVLKYASGQQVQHQTAPEEDILDQLQREEYVPGDKVAKAIKNERAQFDRRLQEIERRYQTVQDSSILAEVKRDHPDFDDVVNPDTLALLKEIDPRRAIALENTPDPYVREATRYDIIKARGLADQVPGAKRAKAVDKQLEQNKKVVQSPQVYDKRPMAKAFEYSRMDKDAQEALRNEMYHYGSMAHGVPNIG